MPRSLFAVILMLGFSSTLLADLGPPPGSKYVSITNLVKLEKSFPDYSFYVVGFGPGTSTITKLELDASKATKVDAKGRFGGTLFSVPNDVVKTFATEDALMTALKRDKLPEGVTKLSISNRTTLKTTDKRDSIERSIVISAGKDKEGLQIAEEKAEKKDPNDPSEPEEPEASALVSSGRRLIAVGLALTVSLIAGGLWILRRK